MTFWWNEQNYESAIITDHDPDEPKPLLIHGGKDAEANQQIDAQGIPRVKWSWIYGADIGPRDQLSLSDIHEVLPGKRTYARYLPDPQFGWLARLFACKSSKKVKDKFQNCKSFAQHLLKGFHARLELGYKQFEVDKFQKLAAKGWVTDINGDWVPYADYYPDYGGTNVAEATSESYGDEVRVPEWHGTSYPVQLSEANKYQGQEAWDQKKAFFRAWYGEFWNDLKDDDEKMSWYKRTAGLSFLALLLLPFSVMAYLSYRGVGLLKRACGPKQT